MSDMNSAVAALKGQSGLPTAGVKQTQAVASPPAASTKPVEPIGTPALQEAQARDMVTQINQGAPTPQPTEAERILAAKDQAISDQAAQINALTQTQTNQAQKVEELLTRLNTSTEEKPPEGPTLPDLPANFDELPADEQLKVQRDAFTSLRSELQNQLKQRDDDLKRAIAPMASEVSKMVQVRDKESVREAFPNFDCDTHKPAIDQYRAEMGWRATAVEAAAVVAAKLDPNMLVTPEATAPHVEVSRPSTQSVSGMPVNQAPDTDRKSVENQLSQAIVQSHATGNSARAGQLSAALLKSKLFGK